MAEGESFFNGYAWIDVNVEAIDDNTNGKVERFMPNNPAKPFTANTSTPFRAERDDPLGCAGGIGFCVQAYDCTDNLVRRQQDNMQTDYKLQPQAAGLTAKARTA
jgi:hypothetical protein